MENSDRAAVGSRDRCRVGQRHGGVGVGVWKDGETALESPGGQRQGRQRHMEIEKRTQGEIEPGIDREPQQEIQSHRDTERQRERYSPRETDIEVCSQSPSETEKHTRTASQSQKVRGRRAAGAGGGQGRAAPSRPLPWSYHSP